MKTTMKKYSTKDFDKEFPTDESCLEWLLNNRYPNGVECPKCGKVTKHYKIVGRPCYSCEICGSHVYPMAGSIFEDTKFDHLKLWFKAVALMSNTRCGISSRGLSRELGVTVKTGYRMWYQIRSILCPSNTKLEGKVEADQDLAGQVLFNVGSPITMMPASVAALIGGLFLTR